ncbi:glycosyltransferase family 2 protein [Algoriphagus mannitolivorans]|uniref:glycosyltransferase family 2 protein n=1 Tax=Algoriphagus mannitolivorans TaxID=226504 RepID=UPI0004200044|nr:glycosyltransferase family A protein [Algoriphagus mannitolivorans]
MISIIVPCFNMGEYLSEAIESVFSSFSEKFEIIIVNDGSTEAETIALLNSFEGNSKIKIVHQENQGLASARNVGVENSKGELLFFLDADNIVLPEYPLLAIKEFLNNPRLGVAYGRPLFFGEVESVPRFQTREFNFNSLLSGNFIDACAFIRKTAFNSVDGFSVDNRLQGWDDWDLWIKVYLANWDFKYIDKYCYKYRVRSNSMLGSSSSTRKKEMLQFIGEKYGFIIHEKYRQQFRLIYNLYKSPFLTFLKVIYHKYFLKRTIY